MPVVSIDALVRAVQEGQLLDPARLRELRESLARAARDAPSLAATLVERGWLTRYQCDRLLRGRGADLVLGPFVLLEPLGAGGMGQVFKAWHRLMNRAVALKCIPPERLESRAAVSRFRREVFLAAQLSHPNIVRVYHADLHNGIPWLAMELVEGVDLYRLLKQRGRLPVAEACDYVRQAALGLQHAHEKDMVHRDIKPHNLMATAAGGQVKVLDLGLARLQSTATMTADGNQLLGTGDYIAPEQVKDPHGVDIRADIYSLGCTLYHLLTGQPPFEGTHPAARPALHLTEEPPPVESLRADLPDGLSRVLRTMMAKRPEDRYGTPAAVAEALTPFCPGRMLPAAVAPQTGGGTGAGEVREKRGRRPAPPPADTPPAAAPGRDKAAPAEGPKAPPPPPTPAGVPQAAPVARSSFPEYQDPAVEAARAPAGRRGLGTRPGLYRRMILTRQLTQAWERAGKYLAHPARRLTRPAEATALGAALTGIDRLLRDFPPLLGAAGQPGYLVAMLARQKSIAVTFKSLGRSRREALARDWLAGRTLLAQYRFILRGELIAVRRMGVVGRTLRAVRALINDHKLAVGLVLFGLAVLGVVLGWILLVPR